MMPAWPVILGQPAVVIRCEVRSGLHHCRRWAKSRPPSGHQLCRLGLAAAGGLWRGGLHLAVGVSAWTVDALLMRRLDALGGLGVCRRSTGSTDVFHDVLFERWI